MFAPDQYELLDVGNGRRLERFGKYLLDRPAPAADAVKPRTPQLWQQADAFFERRSAASGIWSTRSRLPRAWTLEHAPFQLELKCTPSGAIGVYPEQAANWDWIARQVRKARRTLKILNLFAYTGGSTLAAAAAGAEVVHVDAARSAVQWARANAVRSGLESAAIRWIVEDARKFTERERRRGMVYDAVILDPPTYGHGPKAQPWKLTEHLAALLQTIRALLAPECAFVLLTCHAPGMGPPEFEAVVTESLFGHCQAGVTARRLTLKNQAGQRLSSGVMARWPGR